MSQQAERRPPAQPSGVLVSSGRDDLDPRGGSADPTAEDRRGPRVSSWGDALVDDPSPGEGFVLGLGDARLPPHARFARRTDGSVDVRVDELGFFHVYRRQLPGLAALSTSARTLSSFSSPALDDVGVATQSLLGWQLGNRTMFRDVTKIPAGGSAQLARGLLSSPRPEVAHASAEPVGGGSDHPAARAAELLRQVMGDLLDEHADLELQLTGGLDSRLLLAAVPRSRRPGLRVMTLQVPGSADAAIASGLAATYRLDHRLADLDGLDTLAPEDAFDLVLGAARRVDSACDPLALAAVDFAERALPVTTRLAGLGGEVARGFYYFGPIRPLEVTRARTSALARWRMFTNEAAPREMFSSDFRSWAEDRVVDELYEVLRSTGLDWFRATDALYLGQRMQRWAGVLASATAFERTVLNPMLDHRFLSLVSSLPPEQKQGMRFLGQVLVELDPELAALPMDGRPAPSTYAVPSLPNRSRLLVHSARRVVRKVHQRATRRPRPPEGGQVLAEAVLCHLREHPELVADLPGRDLVDPGWLDRVLEGTTGPGVAGVGMLVNLLATRGVHEVASPRAGVSEEAAGR